MSQNMINFNDFGVEDTRFNMPIKFSMINIVTGQNGAGKTILFKAAWFMQFTMQLYKIRMLTPGLGITDTIFQKDLEVIFDLTYTSAEQVSGTIEVKDDEENPSYIYIVRTLNGKIESFDIDILDRERFKVGEINQVAYNSKDARTFSQYDRYLKLCSRFDFNIMNLDPQNQELKDMGEIYRIYDILWFEKVRQELKHFRNQEPANVERLKIWDDKFGNSDESNNFPTSDQFVFRKDTLLVDNLGDLKRASDYDSGTQSLLMMCLFGI